MIRTTITLSIPKNEKSNEHENSKKTGDTSKPIRELEVNGFKNVRIAKKHRIKCVASSV